MKSKRRWIKRGLGCGVFLIIVVVGAPVLGMGFSRGAGQ